MESLMRHLRLPLVVIAITLLGASGAGAGARTPSSSVRTVACDQIVLRSRSGAEDGFRVLLGAVSVPGSRSLAHGPTAIRDPHWRYYRAAGIAIRAGTVAVSVSVPEGWRDRVAVSWGGRPASSSLRFARCGRSPAGVWNSYSGGFHLHARGDCVPLLVTVGGMSTMVRVGVGRACGARR
jgi:hypothetical protein